MSVWWDAFLIAAFLAFGVYCYVVRGLG